MARFAYLPFGVGPRICIGSHFALLEATHALAKLVATFRISLGDARPVLPAAVITTQPDHAPAFRLARRSESSSMTRSCALDRVLPCLFCEICEILRCDEAQKNRFLHAQFRRVVSNAIL
ncbi:cytochrome P450 [Methylobacterium oryzae CBMB20]